MRKSNLINSVIAVLGVSMLESSLTPDGMMIESSKNKRANQNKPKLKFKQNRRNELRKSSKKRNKQF